MHKKISQLLIAASASIFLSTTAAYADSSYERTAHTYKITITNVTKGQNFTPFILASHKPNLHFFTLGEPAGDAIAHIAEGGDTSLLAEKLADSNAVHAIANTSGLLTAGDSVTVMIEGRRGVRSLSIAAMLVPTNDTFIALDGIILPRHGSKTVFAHAYDAGSETNLETCATVPGPQCGGMAFSPEDAGEGFVHLSAGISGVGDLDPATYDWRGPVAKIVIEKIAM